LRRYLDRKARTSFARSKATRNGRTLSPSLCRSLGGCAINVRVSAAKRVYSLHSTEVEWIRNRCARLPDEFGFKVSVATTLHRSNGRQFIAPVKVPAGNPYDAVRSGRVRWT